MKFIEKHYSEDLWMAFWGSLIFYISMFLSLIAQKKLHKMLEKTEDYQNPRQRNVLLWNETQMNFLIAPSFQLWFKMQSFPKDLTKYSVKDKYKTFSLQQLC